MTNEAYSKAMAFCANPGCSGKSQKLHVHHIISRKKGGTSLVENLITLCASCHRLSERLVNVSKIYLWKERAEMETYGRMLREDLARTAARLRELLVVKRGISVVGFANLFRNSRGKVTMRRSSEFNRIRRLACKFFSGTTKVLQRG